MRITYSRVVTGFSLGMIMLVVALAPTGLPAPASVDAGHDDPTTSHLTPDGYIVRNVMFRITIPVCSDDLPLSTAAAARRWNTFFGGDGRVFELDDDGTVFESTDDECRADRLVKRLGIGSVLVVRDDPVDGECMGTACIFRLLTRPDTDWDTITGQPVIYVADYEVEGSDERDPLSDGHVRVTRSITHELGHVFGLEDYETDYCRAAPEGAPNPHHYADVPTIMGPAQRANGTSGVCHSPTPTAKDESDFRLSYVPEAPIRLQDESGSVSANEVVIAWDAFSVHVENEFRIYRKRAEDIWELAGAHAALPLPPPRFTLPLPELEEVRQRARVTLRGQPLGMQIYRVVALTHAPLQDEVAASGEIRVIVKGPPPLAPTGLTATGVVMGINLTWDKATDDPPINGYQYRIDSGEWQDIPSSNASTISYQVRGMLVAGITYAVEIRAVRALVPSEASNTDSATPTAPPQPPPTPGPGPGPPTGRGCLDPNEFGVLTSWRQGCASTSAAALLNILDDDGACAIWLWRDPMWVIYLPFSDGTFLPGSENFTIVAGNTLFVPICTTSRDGAIIPPVPPPIPPKS